MIVEKEDVTDMPEEAVSSGSVYMPVGFLNQNHEYFAFMEMPATQTDMFLEPAILQKVVIDPTAIEPVTHDVAAEPVLYDEVEELDQAWNPVSSHADWESLGERRGVQLSNNGHTWRSFSCDNWEANKQNTRPQYYEKSFTSPSDSWENQSRRWDEPWGL